MFCTSMGTGAPASWHIGEIALEISQTHMGTTRKVKEHRMTEDTNEKRRDWEQKRMSQGEIEGKETMKEEDERRRDDEKERRGQQKDEEGKE